MNAEKFIELSKQGYTYTEIGEMFGKTKSAIQGKIWRHKNPKTVIKPVDTKIKEILEMKGRGLSFGQIALKLNRPRATVSSAYYRYKEK